MIVSIMKIEIDFLCLNREIEKQFGKNDGNLRRIKPFAKITRT